MLTKSQAEEMYNKIKDKEKICMKNLLENAKMALDKDKFDTFKKIVFNNFGSSGLNSSVEKIIKEYTD